MNSAATRPQGIGALSPRAVFILGLVTWCLWVAVLFLVFA